MATTDLITKAKNMLAQTKAEGTKAFKGSAYDQPNVITAQNLAPTKPINLTQPVPSTGAVGMMEELGGMAKTSQDQYTQNLANQATTAKTGMDTSKNELLDYMKGLTGETEATAEAYSQTVDPIQKELTDINNQILSEQQANRRRIQALEKNPTGMLTGALNDEINRVNNESLAKQADLSVIQMGIQGRYSDAKEIADRAVAVKMEQQRNYLDALKFNYQENKELFTKAEQRAFEAAQSDRERALNKQEEDLKTISDMSITALQNGAPTSIASKMRTAKTVEEAIRLGGSYMMTYQDKKARAEYNELINPTQTPGVSVPKSLTELKSADREPFLNARATLSEVNEMQQILNRNSGNLADLELGISEDSRRFKQLRSNVVDKLARERTGAVIGADEKRDFKKILGVGLRQLGIKDIEEINKGLETFKNKHGETIRVIDPDGSIGSYLDQTAPLNIANNIINQYAGSATGSSSLNNY